MIPISMFFFLSFWQFHMWYWWYWNEEWGDLDKHIDYFIIRLIVNFLHYLFQRFEYDCILIYWDRCDSIQSMWFWLLAIDIIAKYRTLIFQVLSIKKKMIFQVLSCKDMFTHTHSQITDIHTSTYTDMYAVNHSLTLSFPLPSPFSLSHILTFTYTHTYT